MKPDKVFILLLVILLPLTGCIDVSDNADAQDSTTSQDTTTASATMPAVVSMNIGSDNTHIETFNGTTLKVETIHCEWIDPDCSSNCPASWRNSGTLSYTMTCADGFTISSGVVGAGGFLPVLGDQECSVEFSPVNYNGNERGTVVIFSLASLSAI